VPVSSFTVHDETSTIYYKTTVDTGTYYWCFVEYCTTRYWHISLILYQVVYNYILSSCSVHGKNQKYVPISSCTVHDNALEICVSI
jgi:hypothetical protein